MTDKDKLGLIGGFTSFLLLIASVPLSAFTGACFFNWYVAPVLHLGPISMLPAWGIGIYVSLFREYHKSAPDAKPSALESVCYLLAKYGVLWLAAGVFHVIAK